MLKITHANIIYTSPILLIAYTPDTVYTYL